MSCESGHEFCCDTQEGALGEIRRSRLLDTEELHILEENPQEASTICPGGSIVCRRCQTPYPGTLPAPEAQTDFTDLLHKLPSERKVDDTSHTTTDPNVLE